MTSKISKRPFEEFIDWGELCLSETTTPIGPSIESSRSTSPSIPVLEVSNTSTITGIVPTQETTFHQSFSLFSFNEPKKPATNTYQTLSTSSVFYPMDYRQYSSYEALPKDPMTFISSSHSLPQQPKPRFTFDTTLSKPTNHQIPTAGYQKRIQDQQWNNSYYTNMSIQPGNITFPKGSNQCLTYLNSISPKAKSMTNSQPNSSVHEIRPILRQSKHGGLAVKRSHPWEGINIKILPMVINSNGTTLQNALLFIHEWSLKMQNKKFNDKPKFGEANKDLPTPHITNVTNSDSNSTFGSTNKDHSGFMDVFLAHPNVYSRLTTYSSISKKRKENPRLHPNQMCI